MTKKHTPPSVRHAVRAQVDRLARALRASAAFHDGAPVVPPVAPEYTVDAVNGPQSN